jgi:hypothetical protein
LITDSFFQPVLKQFYGEHLKQLSAMKKKFIITTVSCFFLIFFGKNSLFAQDQPTEELKITFQLRPRAEVRNGLFTPILDGQKTGSFIAQRTRAGLIYSKENKLKIGISAQSVNTWGNDPQVQFTGNNISLYEAYAQFYFSIEWSVKAGRQVLSYDDERISWCTRLEQCR